MLERVGLPITFVLLWSSAFVAAKSGVVYATPFAFLGGALCHRGGDFCIDRRRVLYLAKRPQKSRRDISTVNLEGDFRQCLCRHFASWILSGCSFYAMANGLGAALTALIVSTQPLLTTALAILLFGEKPRAIQWLGIAIGFCGVIVVLSPSLGHSAPTLSLLASLLALVAITGGTLLQKNRPTAWPSAEQYYSSQRRHPVFSFIDPYD